MMRHIVLLVAALVCAVVAFPKDEINARIIGGAPAVPESTPFVVSLQWVSDGNSRDHFCAGTIVGEKWTLTAANCVIRLPTNGHLQVVGGLYDHADWTNAQSLVVTNIVIHENYSPEVGQNDLAMLFTSSPWDYSQFIQSIPLTSSNQIHGNYVALMGWGDISLSGEPHMPNVLHSLVTVIISPEDCVALIGDGHYSIASTNICTGPMTGGVGLCTGDFGGPLVLQNDHGIYELVGVASWGSSPCGTTPSVYTRVSSFIDWINNIMA